MTVQVTGSDGAWLDQARQRYGAFARPMSRCWFKEASAEGAAPWELHYEVQDGPSLSPDALCRGRRHGLHASPGALVGQDFTARRQPTTRQVEVAGPAAIYPLDLLLQALWYSSRPQSLILHAAALHDGRRAWLCPGPSGSGKSTLVSLSPDRALGDELVAVEVAEGGFDLVALPFWAATPGRYPLAAVCCLRHQSGDGKPPHTRRRLTGAEALARLRGQVSWPTWDAAAMVQCLEVLGQLVESMPVDELAFTPRPDVWECLKSDFDGAER